MRPALATVSFAVLFGMAAATAQVDIPDNIDLDDVDLDDLPDDLPSEIPDSVADELPSGVADEIAEATGSGDESESSTDDGASPSASPSGGSDSDESLASLVEQLPTCAVSCLSNAAENVECDASDIACLCESGEDLAVSIGPCVLTSSSCGSGDADEARRLAPEICNKVNDASDDEVASASSVISDAVETSSANSDDDDDDDSSAAALASGAGFFGSLFMMALAI